jgi:hypothetical protein
MNGATHFASGEQIVIELLETIEVDKVTGL